MRFSLRTKSHNLSVEILTKIKPIFFKFSVPKILQVAKNTHLSATKFLRLKPLLLLILNQMSYLLTKIDTFLPNRTFEMLIFRHFRPERDAYNERALTEISDLSINTQMA